MVVDAKTLAATSTTDRADSSAAPRTRRRGATLEHAILDAAWEEIAAVGYDQATMGSVAARAGTNKAAVYRRWPNRTELLTAAIDRRVVHLDRPPAGTGSLRADAIAVLETMLHRCQAIAVIPDPKGELAAYVRRQAATEAFDQMERAFSRAAQRGDFPNGALHPMVLRLPVDVLYSELALANGASRRQVADIVDHLLVPLTQR
ncbi:MAG TPA: helix-turn-helix domain-containing protein [Acidimicrobiales bacterium]|nr:helix-turn-helix domain-containing protein [Acidimicrobiales bacterium]